MLDKIIIANGLLGAKHGDDVERAKKIANSALARRNTIHMKEAVDALRTIHLQITLIFQLINAIKSASDNFSSTRWKDQNRARQLVDKANSIIDENPTVPALMPIIRELFTLMDVPESEKPKLGF